jgi:hypothetical protein
MATTTVLASADTMLIQAAATTNYGDNASYYIVGWYASANERRGLVWFDISDYTTAQGQVLFCALVQAVGTANPPGINAHALRHLDAAEMQATWNIFKTGSSWTTAGAASTASDYYSDIVALSTATPSAGQWQEWDITSIFNAAVARGDTTLVLRLSTTEAAYVSRKQTQFYPTEHADSAYHSRLLIDEAPPAPPTGLTVALNGEDAVLNWTSEADNDDGTRIYRSTNGTDYSLLATVATPGLETYTDTTTEYGGGTYWYKVLAYNAEDDSTYSNVADLTIRFTPPWVAEMARRAGNPIIGGGSYRETFDGLGTGVDIATTDDWTASQAIQTAQIVVTETSPFGGAGKAVKLSGPGAALDFYDDEHDNGERNSKKFVYTEGACDVGVGLCMSEDGSGLDGYLVKIEQVSGTTHEVNIYRYDNGTPTKLYDGSTNSKTFTLPTGTWCRLAASKVGNGFVYQINNETTWASIVVHNVINGSGLSANEATYWGGRPALYIGSETVTCDDCDPNANSWFVQGFRLICINGLHNTPYRDSNGYYWAIVQFGDASSGDSLGLMKSADPLFSAAQYATGEIEPIVPLAQTGYGSWDTQQPTCMYDPDEDKFKVWFGANNRDAGQDDYETGYAECAADANGAPSTDPWTITHAVLPGRWFPAVVKQPVTHGGTEYAYQMLNMPASTYNNLGLYYSNDGKNWTAYGSNPVKTKVSTVMAHSQLLYFADPAVWAVILVDGSTWPSFTLDIYTSPDLETWTLDRQNFVAMGASGAWDDNRVSDITLYQVGPDWYVGFYAGDAGNRTWPDLATGLLTNGSAPPAAPTALTYDDETQALSWIDESDDETGFRLYKDGAEYDTVAADVTSYEVTESGTYAVAAYNAGGESGYSNVVVVAIPMDASFDAPTAVVVSASATVDAPTQVVVSAEALADAPTEVVLSADALVDVATRAVLSADASEDAQANVTISATASIDAPTTAQTAAEAVAEAATRIVIAADASADAPTTVLIELGILAASYDAPTTVRTSAEAVVEAAMLVIIGMPATYDAATIAQIAAAATFDADTTVRVMGPGVWNGPLKGSMSSPPRSFSGRLSAPRPFSGRLSSPKPFKGRMG